MRRWLGEHFDGGRDFRLADGSRDLDLADRSRVLAVLFGDRIGLALFLGVLAVLPLSWRIGFFITDTYAAANTVVNVAEGHLEITHLEYSLTLGSQPGLYRHGASVFGRNYGQAVLSAPVYWLLEFAAMLTELRLLIAGAWSFVVAAFAAQLARVLDRRGRPVAVWGTVFALVLFGWNVAIAHPLDPKWTGLLALQIVSMVVAAAVGVVYYRLVATLHDRRVGAAAGLFIALGTPVAFWGSIPKRHVLSALLIGVVVAGFAASRTEDDHALRARALAYVAVGVLAWVQEAEALPVLVVLLPLDIATAPNNDPKQLVLVAVAFAASLVPFVLTNLAVTGSPFRTPQMLPGVRDQLRLAANGTVTIAEQAGGAGGGPAGQAAGGTPLSPGKTSGGAGVLSGILGQFFAAVIALFRASLTRLLRLWNLLVKGMTIAGTAPDRLVDVFLRSGRIAGIQHRLNEQEAIELTVLESVPMAAALVVSPVIVVRRIRDGENRLRDRLVRLLGTSRSQTDLLAVGIVSVFSLSYLPRLPIHAQITVRYLLPVMPLLVYLVIRLPPVRRGLRADIGGVLGTYVGTVLIGLPLVVLTLHALDPAIGEAMQFHALLNLAIGGLTTGAVLFAIVRRRPSTAARAIAVAAAGPTILYLLARNEYFTYGEFALPLARWLSQLLPLF